VGTSVAFGVPPRLTRLALIALLAGEILYLTIRFDSQGLDNATSPWLRLVAWSPQFLRLGITVGVAFLFVSARRLWSQTDTASAAMSSRARFVWLGVHLASLLAFVQISAAVFRGTLEGWSPALFVSAWFLIGVTTLGSWAIALAGRQPAALSARANRTVAGVAVGLAALAWLGGFLSEALWRTVASYTFTVVAAILSVVYDDVVSRPERLVLGTKAFRVAIAPSCSGLEGVGLLTAFLGIYLWLFRRELRFPAALMLLPIGAISIWFLNALRIVVLIAIGTSGWKDVALGGFHSQAGWLVFNAVGLGFVALVNRRGLFMKTHQLPRSQPVEDTTAAYLAPFMAVLAIGMITGAFSSGLDWLYPLRVLAAAWVLWIFRRSYTHLGWTLSWKAIAIGVGTFAIWIAMVPAGPTARDQWPAALDAAPMHLAAAWLLFKVVGFTITVPLVEELAFRAYLTRRLMSADVERLPIGLFSWSSFAISSVLFGVLHGGLWLAGTIAGMSFALALYQRRALGDAVLAHATTNGLIAVYVLATGRWSVWS
jgi:exosortase E/protease (VPEID-CTERM system)